MTAGVVNSAYEAVVPLYLQSPAGQSREIETVVDTGFTGYLTLPPALVRDLALPYVTSGPLKGCFRGFQDFAGSALTF